MTISAPGESCPKAVVVIGHECRGPLYSTLTGWHRGPVNALRDLRRTAGLSQRDFAELVGTPLNTFRMWDSGLRSIPSPSLRRAKEALTHHAHQNELLPLDQLAAELGVHVRTLQAAARTGRLEVRFHTRSIFGRPLRRAARAAGETFKRTHYRQFAGQRACPPPLPVVPDDYAEQLKHLRNQLRLTQEALAQRIGAAGKAVVYQWESRKRTPSPVLWQRIQVLRRDT